MLMVAVGILVVVGIVIFSVVFGVRMLSFLKNAESCNLSDQDEQTRKYLYMNTYASLILLGICLGIFVMGGIYVIAMTMKNSSSLVEAGI